MTPRRLLTVVREHLGIENQLHWVLCVVFEGDANWTRTVNAPTNLALIRRLALNLLRTHPDKASRKRKIKRAGWDHVFLNALLVHMR